MIDPQSIRSGRYKRAPIVTDRENPNPQVGTSLTREQLDALECAAADDGISKSAWMRTTIVEELKRRGFLS